jgi:HSP20 family protein
MQLLRYDSPSFSDFDRVFEQTFPLLNRAGSLLRSRERPGSARDAELFETGDGYAVRLELPGVSKDKIDVQVDQDVLTIKVSEKSGDAEGSDQQYSRYERSIRLPREVDASAIKASSENGLLTVHLPKSEEEKPRRIDVS